MIEIDYICPMPSDWNDLHKKLEKAYVKKQLNPNSTLQGRELWESIGLPIPLILAGWHFTTDLEKKLRWYETLEWATKNELLYIIEQPPFEKYR